MIGSGSIVSVSVSDVPTSPDIYPKVDHCSVSDLHADNSSTEESSVQFHLDGGAAIEDHVKHRLC